VSTVFSFNDTSHLIGFFDELVWGMYDMDIFAAAAVNRRTSTTSTATSTATATATDTATYLHSLFFWVLLHIFLLSYFLHELRLRQCAVRLQLLHLFRGNLFSWRFVPILFER
jgi:hypothetical protein